MTDQLSVLRAAMKGRYDVERELGRGGMGTVFLAHDAKHDRRVAIKTLRPELASAITTERFLKEIRFTARLTHPHIVPIHDSGEADGTLYYVMPFVEGESLRHRLNREGRLTVHDALRIARDVADALDHAHRHGVLHRDIKPENILLESGHAVVADFGIARAVSTAGADTLTQTGQLVGTPLYMSPEQALEARDIDGRSDVYSLGCVLYEMLTGTAPHVAPTPQAVLARVLTEPAPPVRAARPDVPTAVEQLVATALAKDRKDRFANARDFAAALEAGRAPYRRTPRTRYLAALGLILLAGVSVVAISRYSRVGRNDSESKIVAVLPFENLGKAEDDYFADGVGDDIRGRLSSLRGVQVIARASSVLYKRSTLTPQQIASELGVRYLLTATVRWDKTPVGKSRIHLRPELVEIQGLGPPTIKWQQPFDTLYTDVLDVQADIAGRVAQALDLILSDSARRQLAAKPTSSLAAYDAYLKGVEASQGMSRSDPTSLRMAATHFAQAVEIDSTFVQAWEELSRTHSSLYFNSTPTPDEAELAHSAAERALALGPNRAEGHFALGLYYYYVNKDLARAATEYGKAMLAAPANADILTMASLAEPSLGRWDSALDLLQRAQALDPRAVLPPSVRARLLLHLRRYPEARTVAERALTLAPDNLFVIQTRTMISLAQGDMVSARAVVAAASKHVDSVSLAAYYAFAWDLYWVLDEKQQQILLRLTPAAFDGDRGSWGIVLAQLYWLRGQRDKAGIYADSARLQFQQQLQDAPRDAQRHALLGLALAYLGHHTDAVNEGRRAVTLQPIAKDPQWAPYWQHQLARIYLLGGETEKALDELEPLLKIPYYLSPGWLRIDPTFDPLRNHPRFQRLTMAN